MSRPLILRALLHGVTALVLMPIVALLGADMLGLFAEEACVPGRACGPFVLATVAGILGFVLAVGATLVWGLTSDREG